ncbi:leucine-rich repeat flightless-interacting protein 1 isoform X19 [Peromyscus leucopus]|uniref:leucine-rich repeat flightless-interacting protein 1 isoform X19 n=1 Tax=Peromyscus leucopus TaxID=10041 RepID=UPI0018855D1B|nr:leucine-rich repeat flightless-interacting protein 1 isoform X19 [Peromyscus leucopus]
MDMGTQGSGRKRLPNRERLTAEDDALNQIAREAEARLAAKRAARAEAREIRMKELERQQKEPSEYSGHLNSSSRASSRASSARASPVVEERPDKDFTEKGSRNMPSLSAATLASLGGTSSRRGSGDTSISMDTEASIREIKELNELKDQIQDVEGKYMQGLKEMKDSLAEVEEKYKKAMVSNAQLDNEKTNFMYQVDTLKDMLLELEEQLAESQRQYEEKNKEFEREKHAHSILQFQFAEVKEALRQREEMLEEIRQLQQKQAGFIREISDLQETIEWKDKKIGALERQKEFFDSIRSERDDLREETVKLKEELKKHGIIINSEIATNGETSDTLNDVGHQAPTKMTKEELNALKSAGEGTLGKAKEVEVEKAIVQNVGTGGTLQNTEQEQPRPNPVKDCVDKGVSHPGENAEDQKPAEDSALSPGPLPGATCEQQVQSQAQENTSFLKNPGQIESREVMNNPDGGTRNSFEQSDCLGGLDSEGSGPAAALGVKNQSENSVGNQDRGKQEDLKTDLEKVSFEPCPHYVLGQTSEVDGVSCTDSRGAGGNPTEKVVQAGGAVAGEQVDTAASGPLEHSEDTVSHDGRCMTEGAEQSSEGELTQGAAKPEVGGENAVTKAGNTEVRDKKPIQAEVQATLGAPIVQSGHQDTAGPGSADAKHAPLDAKEPHKEKSEQQAEALDSPQRKTKNKKKKNKKKKPPASVEARQDASKELNCQNAEAGDLEEEEQTQYPDQKQAVETQSEDTENPAQKITAGSSECVDCPEDPKSESTGKQNQKEEDDVKTQAGKATADRDKLTSEAEEVEEHVTDGPAADGHTDDVLDQDSPQCEEGDISPMGKKGSRKDAKRGSKEGHVLSQHPGQTVEKAVDGSSVDNSDLSGELGGFSSEGGVQTRGEAENSKNKEDCTMS